MSIGEAVNRVTKPFQQNELNTATFMLPPGMDLEELAKHNRGGFSVVMPHVDYPQGIPMEAMRPLVWSRRGPADLREPDLIPQHVNLAEVVANHANNLIITKVPHPSEQSEQPELWVPEGMGRTIVRALERKQFIYRVIGMGGPTSTMSLLDLIVTHGIEKKLDFEWLFEKPSLELLCYKLGIKSWPLDYPNSPRNEEENRWAQIREEIHHSLRRMGNRDMRRQGDYPNFSYAISQTALPEDEAMDLLLMPLITIELYLKEQMPRDPNDRSFR